MKMSRISEAEWQIMKIVWRQPGSTSQDIFEALVEATDWSPATVKTLLNRLVKKKVLGFERRGKSYLYSAKLAEEDCRGAAAESFLDRVFNGSLAPMVAHFVKSGELSRKEIEELEAILRKGGGK